MNHLLVLLWIFAHASSSWVQLGTDIDVKFPDDNSGVVAMSRVSELDRTTSILPSDSPSMTPLLPSVSPSVDASIIPTGVPTNMPTQPTSEPTKKCWAPDFRLGNGVCNSGAANTEQCGWDGGDCCYLSCIQNPNPSKASLCGAAGYDCKDPSMLHPTSVPSSNSPTLQLHTFAVTRIQDSVTYLGAVMGEPPRRKVYVDVQAKSNTGASMSALHAAVNSSDLHFQLLVSDISHEGAASVVYSDWRNIMSLPHGDKFFSWIVEQVGTVDVVRGVVLQDSLTRMRYVYTQLNGDVNTWTLEFSTTGGNFLNGISNDNQYSQVVLF